MSFGKMVLAACAVAGLSGCLNSAPIPAAPDDLRGVAQWLWVHLDDGEVTSIADAAEKLHLEVKGDERKDPLRGGLDDLTAADLAPLGMSETHDPTQCRGIFVTTVLGCTLDQLEPLLYELDQKRLYEGVYDSYQRTYTSDFEAYHSRAADRLSWDVEIDATLVAAKYHESLKGTLRRVERPRASPVLLIRTWMPSPARFGAVDTRWNQDYQLEVFYERAAGEVVHFYAVWRELVLASLGLTSDDNGMVNLQLDNMVKWDERTTKLCQQ